MFRKLTYLMTFFILSAVIQTPKAHADSEIEGKFQDMFVTAGYSAAAGAAIGAALLTFQDDPLKKLNFISMGASIGFLTGTAVGGWLAIAPVFVDHQPVHSSMVAQNTPTRQIVIKPWIDIKRQTMSGLEAGAVLTRF